MPSPAALKYTDNGAIQQGPSPLHIKAPSPSPFEHRFVARGVVWELPSTRHFAVWLKRSEVPPI